MSYLLFYTLYIKYKEEIDMKYEIEMLKEKRVAGFCQRTGNQNKDMPAVIGGLWKKWETVSELQGRKDRKSTSLNSSHNASSLMPSSA